LVQNSRATAVYSTDASRQTSRPSAGIARAKLSDESPVNVPTSTARRAPTSRVSMPSRVACSPLICMPATLGNSERVRSISSATRSSGGVECAVA
jgi:hypothetical protein